VDTSQWRLTVTSFTNAAKPAQQAWSWRTTGLFTPDCKVWDWTGHLGQVSTAPAEPQRAQ